MSVFVPQLTARRICLLPNISVYLPEERPLTQEDGVTVSATALSAAAASQSSIRQSGPRYAGDGVTLCSPTYGGCFSYADRIYWKKHPTSEFI